MCTSQVTGWMWPQMIPPDMEASYSWRLNMKLPKHFRKKNRPYDFTNRYIGGYGQG